MVHVSNTYKEIMNRAIRNRAYMSVSVGVINQEAQGSGMFDGTYAYWSNLKFPFGNKSVSCRYATIEQDYLKADGNMCFMSEDSSTAQYKENRGMCALGLSDSITISFPTSYSIKGLTIDFDDAYPTEFSIATNSGTTTYSNTGKHFETTDVLGDTDNILITPVTMVGGNQRLRINNIAFGVGINYLSSDISSSDLTEFVHSVCEELPSIEFNLTVFDYDNVYNIDNDNSFANFLQTMQKVDVSIGLELDNGSIEWVKIGSLYLDDWKSQKGSMRFVAHDRISFMDDIYTGGNTIHSRTLYSDAEAVLTAAGLEPDEYEIDECLKDITVTNPLPEVSQAECLQLIAIAGRCILFQNKSGKVCIKANFANVIEPSDITVTTIGASPWSVPENTRIGSTVVYADMTKDFSSADGSMLFMPETTIDYTGNTGFISADIADNNGLFTTNPSISLALQAGYIYYSVYIDFDGNPPEEMVIHTFLNDVAKENVTFTGLNRNNVLNHEFLTFDKMTFEFTNVSPFNRVLVSRVAFGDLAEYVLTKGNMLEEPIGVKEKQTKSVSVKVFTFTNDSNSKPVQTDDSVYYTKTINTVGNVVTFENQLISTSAHAQEIAEWLGNYYLNNVSYEVTYRGEPRLDAADIIFMESDAVNNLQVEIETSKLTFNGAFRGSLEMRRAFGTVGV